MPRKCVAHATVVLLLFDLPGDLAGRHIEEPPASVGRYRLADLAAHFAGRYIDIATGVSGKIPIEFWQGSLSRLCVQDKLCCVVCKNWRSFMSPFLFVLKFAHRTLFSFVCYLKT